MSDDDETVKPPDLQEWVKRYGGYDKLAIGKHRIAPMLSIRPNGARRRTGPKVTVVSPPGQS